MILSLFFSSLFFLETVFASVPIDVPANFKASFVQSYVSELTGKVKSNEGDIEYSYPGKIRLELKAPENTIFVGNEKKTWFYRAPFIKGEPGQLSVGKSKDLALLKLLDLIKDKKKTSDYFDVEIAKDKKLHRYISKDRFKKETSLSEASLQLKSESTAFENLEKIELVYVDGKKVSITFKSLDSKAEFRANRFVFEPPAGTKVSQQNL